MPKVTIGMPTYNRAEYLKTSIPQVLNQTYSDFEFIICDDCSSDNTPEVVKSFSDSRIRYYRNEKNLNIPGVLNRILNISVGEYIIFLHDHDIFEPNLLKKMCILLETNPEIGFVHPGVAFINSDGSSRKDLIADFPIIMSGHDLADKILLSDNFTSPICACGVVRRKAYEEVGFYYDDKFGFVSDVDMWLRLLMKFKVGYINEPILFCRIREDDHQFSKVSWKVNKWLVGLFKENIDRKYKNDKALHALALKIWQKKTKKLYRHSLIKSLVDKNYKTINDGISIIKSEPNGLFNILFCFLRIPFIFTITSSLLATINKVRKK